MLRNHPNMTLPRMLLAFTLAISVTAAASNPPTNNLFTAPSQDENDLASNKHLSLHPPTAARSVLAPRGLNEGKVLAIILGCVVGGTILGIVGLGLWVWSCVKRNKARRLAAEAENGLDGDTIGGRRSVELEMNGREVNGVDERHEEGTQTKENGTHTVKHAPNMGDTFVAM